jgi:ribosomal protein S12 methylthiotransferase accessory factor YcaO
MDAFADAREAEDATSRGNDPPSRLDRILGFAGAMEAAGIEPASADAPDRTSTSVVCASLSPSGWFADDPPAG